MRTRPSSRLLILDPEGRVLRFRFILKKGALAGESYWATPGGGLEDRETFEQAALRELKEETGLEASKLAEDVARREFLLRLPSGEQVIAQERFFVVRSSSLVVCRDAWTVLEREVISDHRWWSIAELDCTEETVWPEDLATLLRQLPKG